MAERNRSCPHKTKYVDRVHDVVRTYQVSSYRSCPNCLNIIIKEMHKLLKHYANLLNMYDQGERDIPESLDAFAKRVLK